MTAPGTRLRALARRVCRPQTVERLVDPIVADLQCEYADANEPSKRRLVLWRGYAAFWRAAGIHVIQSAIQRRPGDADGGMARVFAYSLAAFVLITVSLVLPPLLGGLQLNADRSSHILMALLLVPQALPMSIPAGVCIGVICAMRAHPSDRRRAATVLMLGAAGALAGWTLMEWGIPAANQRFREVVAAQLADGRVVHLEPGLGELPLSDLGRRTDAAALRHFHQRWALVYATIPLAVFALGISARVRRLPVAVAAGLVTIVAYVMLMFGADGPPLELPGGNVAMIATAWMPNLIFLTIGLALLRGHRQNVLDEP